MQVINNHVLYLSESCWAEVWNVLQMGMTSRLSFSFISSDPRKVLATRSRASSGHGWHGKRDKKNCKDRSKDMSMQRQTGDTVKNNVY